MKLSIIIPAHNEEKRLPASLREVLRFLQSQSYRSEVLVVENGSTDATAQVVESIMQEDSSLRLLREDEAGKGLAVRRGILEAAGEYVFICDADLSMPIEEVSRFLPPQLTAFDVAIGSREIPGAVRYNEPALRHWIGRIFNLLVRWLAVPGFHDTQCGFKCLRREVAQDLFAVQHIQGWGFDVEILFLALKRGFRIVEVPISWYYNADTRIRMGRDSLQMFSDIWRIRAGWRKGHYEAQA